MVEIAWPVFVAVPVGVLLLTFLIASCFIERAPRLSFAGKHAVITGGSSGIGLALAAKLIQRRVHVTIIARDPARLHTAVQQLQAQAASAPATASLHIAGISADISDAAAIRSAVVKSHADSPTRTIDLFVASAGMTTPGAFDQLPDAAFERNIGVNYLGTVWALRAVIPLMKQQNAADRSGSRIMIVSSMAGLSGVYGYSAYSGSKFALRGLAEALHMELKPHNVWVSLCNPPDVDTPMFAEENKIKPVECKLISEGSGLFTADQIADDMMAALANWKFLVNSGMDGHFLALIATGTSPAHSAVYTVVELLFVGLIRVVSLAYRWNYNNIVIKCYKEKQKKGDKAQ